MAAKFESDFVYQQIMPVEQVPERAIIPSKGAFDQDWVTQIVHYQP
ncbi:MAG: hypothetical protein MK052_12010 [Alphaproteobacteria bacterium]|nr:hypothetical protein [Alphaproteobacteria bacterium]